MRWRSPDAGEVKLFTAPLASLLPFVDGEGGDGEFHGPSIDEFFPEVLLFAGTPFELNRVLLIRVLAVVAVSLILWAGTRAMTMIPNRRQAGIEFVIDFVRKGIVIETLGEKDGKRFMPILLSIFFLVLALNLTATIPGLQIPSTGLIGQALILAIVSYGTFIYAGVRKHGVTYFKKAVVLPGVPIFISPIIAILEVLSTFIIRPVTLTLRLTMNMVAGHMLLVLCFLATDFFFFQVLANGNPLGLLGVGTFAFGVAFVVLEIFVGALQAYVFTILTAIYIQMALADEH